MYDEFSKINFIRALLGIYPDTLLEFLKFLNQYNVPVYLWYFIRFSANPKDRESPDHQEPEE